MICIRANKKNAEATRAYLNVHKLMDKQHKVVRRNSFIYFPVSRIDDKAMQELAALGAKRSKMQFTRSSVRKEYRQTLLREIGYSEYDKITKSYDLIGDTAIIDESGKNARKLAQVIMSVNKNVKRVIRKNGAVSGIYRTRKFSHVAGEHGYTVRYRENGIILQLDIRKSFFSPRLSYERKRISGLAKDFENVVVLFAGVGPFALLIAKEHKNSNVVAIELNKSAYDSMLYNIRINRLSNVVPVLGDAKKEARKYRKFADRIVMPLPKDAYNFLGSANEMARDGCVVHYYAFSKSKDPYSLHMKRIHSFFSKHGKAVRFSSKRIVRTYSASEVEIVLDFRVFRQQMVK